jgi:hypothetical protein
MLIKAAAWPLPFSSEVHITFVNCQIRTKLSRILFAVFFYSAAIPLVDPEFNLLPIHFAIDPGQDWNGVDCLDGEPSVTLLRHYLDVQEVPIPATSSGAPSSSSSVQGANESIIMPKSGSWSELGQTVSTDSTFTECSASKNNRDGRKSSVRDGRKLNNGVPEDTLVKSASLSRNKFPLQMHNVARSFGSLGRSFKKLKKNFVMIARRGTLKRIDKKDRSSASSPVDSSGTTANNEKTNREFILCARLLHRRQPYQEDMVRNYLSNAMERFQQECDKHKLECSERLNATVDLANYENAAVTTKCVNADCHGLGDAATAYLCTSCYERQKRDEIDAASAASMPGDAVPSSVMQTNFARSSSGCRLIGTATNGSVFSSIPCGSSVVVYDNLHSNVNARNSPSVVSSSSRRQFTDSLERQLDELQKTVERMPGERMPPIAFRIE